MAALQNYEALHGILAMLVFAKEKGMMDHREAKELWNSALKEAGISVTVGPNRQGG